MLFGQEEIRQACVWQASRPSKAGSSQPSKVQVLEALPQEVVKEIMEKHKSATSIFFMINNLPLKSKTANVVHRLTKYILTAAIDAVKKNVSLEITEMKL